MPEGLGFSTFDLTHLAWLLVAIIAIVLAYIFDKKQNNRGQRIMLTVLGLYIFFQEMLKNVVVAAVGEFSWGYLPFHLCGINILLIAFDVIKQTKIVRTFLYYIGIPGAALALIFPNWTSQPVWNFFHLHSFILQCIRCCL